MAVTFGEVAFTLVDLQVAPVTSSGYGTAVDLDYQQVMEIEPQHDTHEIKAGGKLVELLSVVTHANFKISQGLVDQEALAVIAGTTATTSGTTPNQTKTTDLEGGGAGLPYFGVIGKLVSNDGAALMIGLPKCKLDAAPATKSEQNQFVMAEASGRAIADSNGIIVRYQAQETAGNIDFSTFFS